MKTLPAIFIVSLTTLLIACGKDKFETKPKLEIKDYSSKEIFQGQTLTIRLNYFDKEGDLGGAPVIGILKRLNILPLPPGQDKVDTFLNNLPKFPKKDNGEITFQLGYNFLNEGIPPNGENDTLVFRFAVTDLAGNKSDTITTDQIVIHLP
jgi:hypothetical protein